MAEMNLDFYTGSDSYSDGDVEDRLLFAVRSSDDPENAASEERGAGEGSAEDAFAYLYHLSPVRENILSWYPFRKDACALEIGAGPGAVTGILCRKLRSVTSVDLSKRRCAINYERHKKLDNLKIMVGNLNDMRFSGFFDYVILNGVFEYAASFTKGEHPYETFLRTCSSFLKKDGVLLVAIENRLGLKYFAGAPEDHTGNYMEGLKGYRQGSGVRTFSKSEWEELAGRCGLRVRKFYYPYPDYKFPGEVFTDESLTADSWNRNNWNFSDRRLELFPEQGIAALLNKEGVLSSFMNSFLLELTYEGEENEDSAETGEVIYAKMNADRDVPFRIQTVIRRMPSGRTEVVKSPLTEEAKTHLMRMAEHEERSREGELELSGRKYPVLYLRGRKEGDSLVYPYLEGDNLGSLAAEAADSKDAETVQSMTDALWRLILSGAGRTEKVPAGAAPFSDDGAGPRFPDVFGSELPEDPGELVCPANIDLIFDNLIVSGGAVQVIDGEWIFDFPVPARFILWRAVNELYSGHEGLSEVLPRRSLLERYGIGGSDAQRYWSWADYFEKKYLKANRLAAFAREVKKADLKDIHSFEGSVRLTSTLYIDRGQGFSEKDAVRREVSLKDGRYEAEFEVPDPASVKALRFDPAEGAPLVCTLRAECGKLKPVNAARVKKIRGGSGRTGVRCEFLTKDPSYLLDVKGKVKGRIRIAGKLELQTEDWALERAGHLLSRYQRIFRV